jgi:hypothetical protein
MKFSFDHAVSLAGTLYGNLLGRAADKEGFDSVVDELNSGARSVRDFVAMLLTSEEFREKFLMNNTPNEAAKQLRMALLREVRPSPAVIKTTAVDLLETDWRAVVAQMIASDAYGKAFGESKIPLIRYS